MWKVELVGYTAGVGFLVLKLIALYPDIHVRAL
jgi:hypothetical protein